MESPQVAFSACQSGDHGDVDRTDGVPYLTARRNGFAYLFAVCHTLYLRLQFTPEAETC